MSEENENQGSKPDLIAYHVRQGKNQDKGFWTRIGAAWATKSGDGYNVSLDCLPTDGRLVLIPPKADDEAE